MSSVLFSDHPVCEWMAEKAMHDPKYELQLEKSASGKHSSMNLAIEKDMTNFRHKLLMLSNIEYKTHQRLYLLKDIRVPREARCAILSTGRAPANSGRALRILAEKRRLQTDPKPFPLLRLPIELRQQIYQEVLKGTCVEIIVKSFDILACKEDYPNCKIETFYGNRASPHWKNPVSTFKNATPGFYGKDITTGLLLVSKSVYAEAVPILYCSRTFDFGVDVFGIVPFLRKMTPVARQSVRSIHMEFYALPEHMFKKSTFRHYWGARNNTQDWTEACAYIADHLQLKKLSINADFEPRKPADPPVDFLQSQWVKDLVQINGLQSLSPHASPHEHALDALRSHAFMRFRYGPSERFSPGPDDVVDGNVKGAKPGLGKLFNYLRGEMLEKSTRSDPSLKAAA